MKELSVTGFLSEFLEQHLTRRDRPFCWILGAGASASSEIPTAGKLARAFLERLCENATGSKENCTEWAKNGALKIDGFDPADPGRHYAELYDLRYGDCPEAGYAHLEDLMRDKRPSYGYAVLALLLEKTPHRIVITTNFDNLVADALSVHSTTFPRVVGHAQLTQFVQTEVRRPLVAKIHGDLGFRVRNTPTEIGELDADWKHALERIFRRCTPIVVGYGGNDQSLMKFIAELPDDVPDRVYWCQWEREQPAAHVADYLGRRKGARLVRHKGFDLLMLLLENKLRADMTLELPRNLAEHLGQRQSERLALFREQRDSLAKDVATSGLPTKAGPAESASNAKERQAIAVAASQSFAGTGSTANAKSWWEWELEALVTPTPEERDRTYRRAIEALPNSAELLGSYATFLRAERRDLDRAEEYYKRAIDADPKDADRLGSYANFLCDERRDPDRAEEYYKRALDVEPRHAVNLGNYAVFLRDERRDLDRAEEYYKRAIDSDPKDADNLGNYAAFLYEERRDLDRAEEYYKRAIEADPKNAFNLGSYANFLCDERRDLDRAEEYYKRAIDADPKDTDRLGSYANFLCHERRDLDRAEEYYKRAIEADPKNAFNLGNFATFLCHERRDLDRAEEYHTRATDADPKDADLLSNYATFLYEERRDLDRAEECYKRAIDVDPKDADNLGDYATFLYEERRDLDRAEEYYKRALDFDPKDALSLGNYARLLFASGRSVEGRDRLAQALACPNQIPALSTELRFYAYAHCRDKSPDALGRLKGLLLAGSRSKGWDLSGNVSRARAESHPEAELVAALSDVIAERADIATLDRFPVWRETAAIAPDAKP